MFESCRRDVQRNPALALADNKWVKNENDIETRSYSETRETYIETVDHYIETRALH